MKKNESKEVITYSIKMIWESRATVAIISQCRRTVNWDPPQRPPPPHHLVVLFICIWFFSPAYFIDNMYDWLHFDYWCICVCTAYFNCLMSPYLGLNLNMWVAFRCCFFPVFFLRFFVLFCFFLLDLAEWQVTPVSHPTAHVPSSTMLVAP